MAAIGEPKILSINLGHLALKEFSKNNMSIKMPIRSRCYDIFQWSLQNNVDFLVFQATKKHNIHYCSKDCFTEEFMESFALLETYDHNKKRCCVLAIAFNIRKFVWDPCFSVNTCPIEDQDGGSSTQVLCFQPILLKNVAVADASANSIYISNTSAGLGKKERILHIATILCLLKKHKCDIGHFFFCQDHDEENDEAETTILLNAKFSDITNDSNCPGWANGRAKLTKIFHNYVRKPKAFALV